MSRRDRITSSIDFLINQYKCEKDKENLIKKENARRSTQIKEYFEDNDIDKYSTNMYTATVTNTKKEMLNEDLAIEIIKENLDGALLKSVIKQKEYIDEDALEKLVYNHQFDVTKLEKATMTSYTKTLRVTKRKDN